MFVCVCEREREKDREIERERERERERSALGAYRFERRVHLGLGFRVYGLRFTVWSLVFGA